MKVYLDCPVCGKSITVDADSEYVEADRQIGIMSGGNVVYGITYSHTCVDFEDMDGNALTVTESELTVAVQEALDR